MRTMRDLTAFTQRARRQEMMERYLIKNSKRTPKPEKMFEQLWRDGVAYVKRRRGKPPILVFVKDV